MSAGTDAIQSPDQKSTKGLSTSGHLFVVSWLILFLELACIRWFPSHVLYLTFFTNTVLLACFLGMSVGCVTAGQARNWLTATPVLLGLAMAAAHGIEYLGSRHSEMVDVGNQVSPQVVYFGTEARTQDVARFVIPHEVIGGFFFLVIALAMVGPGQELGRALNRIPNRVQAYTVNILGSIVGILMFSLCSWWQLSPFWWFLPIVLILGYGIVQYSQFRDMIGRLALLVMVLLASSVRTRSISGPNGERQDYYWSPYYRVDYTTPKQEISVNLIGHQTMVSRDGSNVAYAIPHLLNRDARRVLGEETKPFSDVLIIGAGSGNDVSRALQWDAKHIDAVEIDPVINRLGRMYHPDHPYQDERVTVHLDDGREFLRSSDRQYDLIIYALVDSLILHSSYSNIRLESYLFTQEAFEEVRRHLKPGGVFVMYNYFRQGWIVARLQKGLQQVFGTPLLVLTLPYQERVEPEQAFGGFTLFFCGEGVKRLEETFRRKPLYWLSALEPANPSSPNGFEISPVRGSGIAGTTGEQEGSAWLQFGPAQVVQPVDDMRTASDDWPFLYLRRTMIPTLTQRGIAIMGGLGLLLVFLFMPRGRKADWGMNGRMFFLGAGFMLVETTAVVRMALLFGSTWIVNAVVFLAVLVMILGANLYVLRWRPRRLWPFYVGLLASLVLNVLTPLDFFPKVLGRNLGLPHSLQVAGACLVVFTPILFAGVIFAVSFARTKEADLAFGANIAGAMVGGLTENSSMLLGFQYLLTVSIVFYVLSAVVVMMAPGWRARAFPPAHPQ
jgi:SAM-dependent methyltransferase